MVYCCEVSGSEFRIKNTLAYRETKFDPRQPLTILYGPVDPFPSVIHECIFLYTYLILYVQRFILLRGTF